ncbi:MAG TPA: SAM-dependent methyltransferase [Natronosporangium sp.]
MRRDYTEVFLDPAVVDRYEHLVYAPDSYASAVNQRQRRYLRQLVRRAFPVRRPVQHDFACGTGRAIRLLHGLVRAAHGYDTSPMMLAKAAEVGTLATLHQVEATGPVPDPVPAPGPAIVTIFRTLLNADESTRDRAIGFAAKILPRWESGLLVVENHGNRSSLRHLRQRRHAGEPWFGELSHQEVAELLARHGFTVVERRGFAMLTRGWYGIRGLRLLARGLDELAGRIRWLHKWSVNVLYVARRTT